MNIYEEECVKNGYSGYVIREFNDTFGVIYISTSISTRNFTGTYEDCLNYINIMRDDSMRLYHNFIKKYAHNQCELEVALMD